MYVHRSSSLFDPVLQNWTRLVLSLPWSGQRMNKLLARFARESSLLLDCIPDRCIQGEALDTYTKINMKIERMLGDVHYAIIIALSGLEDGVDS